MPEVKYARQYGAEIEKLSKKPRSNRKMIMELNNNEIFRVENEK